MTRDEALLWMNDRIGRQAVVADALAVLSARGVLTHAGQELYANVAPVAKALGQDELDYDGVYRIGGAGDDADATVRLPTPALYSSTDLSLRFAWIGADVMITVF